MTGKRKRLDPTLDIVFWMLFGEERNRALLISLLNAVLRPIVPIEEVEVLHAQPERASVDDKSIALDVRVRLVNREQIDVEMQSQWREAQRERGLYYWARLYSGQLNRGQDYASLRRCVVVAITNYTELEEPRFHSIFRLRSDHSSAVLSDHLELHYVQLPHLAEALEQNDEHALVLWGKFFAAVNDEELERLADESPMLKQAKDALDRLSDDPKARERAEMREMALLSYEMQLTAAREAALARGLAEGKAEGLAEGKAEGLAEGKAEGLAEAVLAVLRARGLAVSEEQRAAIASCRDGSRLAGWLEAAVTVKDAESLLA
jgi:predicted transposase/invertase (TIGR01784 family)